jgi:hypothetical protein
MRRASTRAALVATAGLGALVLAGTAFAANTATISVSYSPMKPGSSQATTIKVDASHTDSSIAQVNIYTGAAAVTSGGAANTQIGQVDATANAHDVPGGLILPLSGPVTTADPAQHVSDVCSPGQNFAVWNMNLSAAGQTLVIPIYVNPTSGASAALGAYDLKICLPPWDTPPGSPGHAFMGAQLLTADLTLNKVVTAPGSTSAWDALFTPYAPATGVPNVAGTFEARAVVPLPLALGIHATYKRKTNAWGLAGRISEGGQPVAAGTVVSIFRGRSTGSLKKVSTTRVRAGGAWSTAGHLSPRQKTFFQIAVSLPVRDDTSQGCANPAAPAGCVSATLAGWNARSAVVSVRP